MFLFYLAAPLRWWRSVRFATLGPDLAAGITGGVVVLPQAVAFAIIAGLPPIYGIYAALIPTVVASFWGSSVHLLTGPTTAISVVVASVLTPLAAPGSEQYIALATTLAVGVGVIQIILALARLGHAVQFISHTVIVGFTAAAALLIAASQLRHLLGLELAGGAHTTAERLFLVLEHIEEINPFALGVGVLTLVAGLFLRRWTRTWYLLGAMLVGIAAAELFHVGFPEEARLRVVGSLQVELPHFSPPTAMLDQWLALAPGMLTVALLGLTEAMAIARAVALKSGQKLDSNQEFFGQGLANLVGGLFSAYPVSGSFNRTGIHYEAGARTPIAALVAALTLAVLLVFIAPLAEHLPYAALAGLLLLVAWGLVDLEAMREIIRSDRAEGAILASTFLSSLVLELEYALLLGVALSLAIYLYRTARPVISERIPDATHAKRSFVTPALGVSTCPQLKVVRIEGPLYFAAVEHVQEAINRMAPLPQTPWLMLILRSAPFVDLQGVHWLAEEAARRRAAGGDLVLYRPSAQTQALLERTGLIEAIGRERIFAHKEAALAAALARVDRTRCRNCSLRIFRECMELAAC